jgi:hypothetical protein
MTTEWLSPEQVCDVVPGLTTRKLQRLRDDGKGPRYAKPTGKTVVYSRTDVDAWVRSTSVETKESR